MSGNARTPQAVLQPRLEMISRRLGRLLSLRAALSPFQASLRVLGERAREPDGRRRLLTLWRPCQQRLDLLLDGAPGNSSWAVRLRLLRHEMEDSLIDDVCNPIALSDLTDALDQACEAILLHVQRDLREVVTRLGGGEP
ncbi:MAG: hypothetical protein PVH62_04135 [Anaerolineae bacterium]